MPQKTAKSIAKSIAKMHRLGHDKGKDSPYSPYSPYSLYCLGHGNAADATHNSRFGAEKPSLMAVKRSPQLALGSDGMLSLRIRKVHTETCPAPIIKPGTIPPKNGLFLIEMCPATPIRISAKEGDITGAKMPPRASKPIERPSREPALRTKG